MPVPLILPPSEARRVLLDAALCEACPTLRQIAATAGTPAVGRPLRVWL